MVCVCWAIIVYGLVGSMAMKDNDIEKGRNGMGMACRGRVLFFFLMSESFFCPGIQTRAGWMIAWLQCQTHTLPLLGTFRRTLQRNIIIIFCALLSLFSSQRFLNTEITVLKASVMI